MANFCLLPSEVDKFKQAIVDGNIDPAKLATMTSEERRAVFAKHVGEVNAKDVNALFESKLLLKDQQRGMVTWAKAVSGMKPEVKRDMITRIQRLDRVLSPAEHEQFLEDLAAQKLGANVTRSEAKTIAELSRRVEETKATMDNGGDRLAHGRAVVALENYVLDLKSAANKLKFADYLKHPVKTFVSGAGQTKAISASMDNSAIFRQGWKTLFTNPVIWQKNARFTFRAMIKEFGKKPVMDEVRADILSRPNAVNGYYKKMGLDIGTLEEPFPTHLPGKIPILGRVYKASESAYSGFVYRMRADIADKYLEIAKKSNVNIADKSELQSIGNLVNSLTGRGKLGNFERVAGKVNNVFFSPRFLKSNYDFLTGHNLQKGVTPFVRKQAALNLVKVISGTAAILAIADAVKPGSVDWDPRSANYGKIKIGDTRFDVAGGLDSIVTLASRIMPTPGPKGLGFYSKSSITNQLSELNSGAYGSQTSADVFFNFFENKLSPVAGVVRDMATGKTPQGTVPTIAGSKIIPKPSEILKLGVPLSLQNYNELKSDPNSANNLVAGIADGLGLVTNTYGKSTDNWNQNTTKAQDAFRAKVGQQKFDQANQDYNKALDSYIQKLVNDSRYKSLSQKDQQEVISTKKEKLQAEVMKNYGFNYKRAAPNKADNAIKKSLIKL